MFSENFILTTALDASHPKPNDNSTTLLAIVYNGKVYASVSAFRAAWSAPGFEKLPEPKDGDWTTMDRGGMPFPNDAEPGPKTITTSQRFSIDRKNQYVEWMGFSFYMSMSQQLGLGLHNINYDGERIIYELQMQEAIALYSANDPLRAQTFYLDSTIGGFGGTLNKLVPGWDCPETAAYLDTYFMNGSLCIFERDAGFPLARHRGEKSGSYVTVVKNNILVLRTISTIGNYDYMFDYQFFYDGSMEVTVRASGYIEGTHAGGNEEHGYKIHDALSGAMVCLLILYKMTV
jgi:primary-amine oxidase